MLYVNFVHQTQASTQSQPFVLKLSIASVKGESADSSRKPYFVIFINIFHINQAGLNFNVILIRNACVCGF